MGTLPRWPPPLLRVAVTLALLLIAASPTVHAQGACVLYSENGNLIASNQWNNGLFLNENPWNMERLSDLQENNSPFYKFINIENIDSAQLITNVEYFNVQKEDNTIIISTGEHFNIIERNVALRNPLLNIEIEFICNGARAVLRVVFELLDNNNYNPEFTKESYGITLTMPLPSGYDLGAFLSIEGLDYDITGRGVDVEILPDSDKANGFSAIAQNTLIGDRTFSVGLVTTKELRIEEPLILTLRVTDRGTADDGSTLVGEKDAAIIITPSDETVLSPRFKSALYTAVVESSEDVTLGHLLTEPITFEEGYNPEIQYTLVDGGTLAGVDASDFLQVSPVEGGVALQWKDGLQGTEQLQALLRQPFALLLLTAKNEKASLTGRTVIHLTLPGAFPDTTTTREPCPTTAEPVTCPEIPTTTECPIFTTTECPELTTEMCTCPDTPTTTECPEQTTEIFTCPDTPTTTECPEQTTEMCTCPDTPTTTECPEQTTEIFTCPDTPTTTECPEQTTEMCTCPDTPTTTECPEQTTEMCTCPDTPTTTECPEQTTEMCTCPDTPTTTECPEQTTEIFTCPDTPTTTECPEPTTEMCTCPDTPTTTECPEQTTEMCTCPDTPTTTECPEQTTEMCTCPDTPTTTECPEQTTEIFTCPDTPTTTECPEQTTEMCTCPDTPTTTECPEQTTEMCTCPDTPTTKECPEQTTEIFTCPDTPTTTECPEQTTEMCTCPDTPTTVECPEQTTEIFTCPDTPTTTECPEQTTEMCTCPDTPTTTECPEQTTEIFTCPDTPTTTECPEQTTEMCTCPDTPTTTECPEQTTEIFTCPDILTTTECPEQTTEVCTCPDTPTTTECPTVTTAECPETTSYNTCTCPDCPTTIEPVECEPCTTETNTVTANTATEPTGDCNCTECTTTEYPSECPTTVCPIECPTALSSTTECPTVCPTEATVIVTDCPTQSTGDCLCTDCPTTECPTECPTTVCPIECPTDSTPPTECPTVCPTESTVTATECPTVCPTESTVTATECPTVCPTESTVTAAECPTAPTGDCNCTECTTTEYPSECPTTVCPIECPTALSSTTECPTVCPTEATIIVTECPTESTGDCLCTDCPTTECPTECPTTVCPIECPTAPSSTTECPTVCPTESTVTAAECPTAPTGSTVTATECPTVCPTESTVTATECPTVCPTESTVTAAECPTAPTECPDSSSTDSSTVRGDCSCDSCSNEDPDPVPQLEFEKTLYTEILPQETPTETVVFHPKLKQTVSGVVFSLEAASASSPLGVLAVDSRTGVVTLRLPPVPGHTHYKMVAKAGAAEATTELAVYVPVVFDCDGKKYFSYALYVDNVMENQPKQVLPGPGREEGCTYYLVDNGDNHFTVDQETGDLSVDSVNREDEKFHGAEQPVLRAHLRVLCVAAPEETAAAPRSARRAAPFWEDAVEKVQYDPTSMVVLALVQDENDNAPEFPHASLVVGFPERELAAQLRLPALFTAEATDADIGLNAQLRYSLDAVGAQQLEVHPATGAVYPRSDVAAPSDGFSFVVRATDRDGEYGAAGTLSGSLQVTLRTLSAEHLVEVRVGGQLPENATALLEEAASDGNVLRLLSATVLPLGGEDQDGSDEDGGDGGDGGASEETRLPRSMRVRRAADEAAAVYTELRLVVYALRNNQPIEGDEFKGALKKALEDVGYKADAEVADLGGNNGNGNGGNHNGSSNGGLLAAVIVLAVLLGLVLVAAGVVGYWFGIRPRYSKQDTRDLATDDNRKRSLESVIAGIEPLTEDIINPHTQKDLEAGEPSTSAPPLLTLETPPSSNTSRKSLMLDLGEQHDEESADYETPRPPPVPEHTYEDLDNVGEVETPPRKSVFFNEDVDCIEIRM